MFRAIASEDFPPFGEFRLDLPPVGNKPDGLAEVHLLTGVNGTGKTRLLGVVAAMLGGKAALLKRTRGLNPTRKLSALDVDPQQFPKNHWPFIQAGSAAVSGFTAPQPTRTAGEFVRWAAKVPAFAYNGIAYVADAKITVMAGVSKPEREACLSFTRPEGHSAELLQAISNLKVQSAMDSMNGAGGKSATRSTQLMQALERTLSEVTGQPFQFTVTTYPQPCLMVKWANSELPFDLLPDGLRSVIGWLVGATVMLDAWLQGATSPMESEVVFLLDEIESHLHPAWQRKILPAFQRLFPKAQIFVATHSPFVIASLNVGWIHRLTLGSDGKVKIEEPIPASAGDSYVSVVEDIMGLQEWYDPETEQLLTQFRQKRDAAYQGDAQAQAGARDLATTIGKRSMELDYLMGRELSQMDRQLAKAGGK